MRRGKKKSEFFSSVLCFQNCGDIQNFEALVGSGLNQICNLAELIPLNYLGIIKIEQFLMDS